MKSSCPLSASFLYFVIYLFRKLYLSARAAEKQECWLSVVSLLRSGLVFVVKLFALLAQPGGSAAGF